MCVKCVPYSAHRRAPGESQADRAAAVGKGVLSRDYHSMNANRFLFSCADEYDGCAQNKGGKWAYLLPESAFGSMSSLA